MIEELKRLNHGGRVVEVSRKYGIPRNEILDFSSNTNPLGHSKKINSLTLADFELTHFSDDSYSGLIEIISEKYNCDGQNVIVGNGSTEIIRNICYAFVCDGTKVVIPTHTYSEYEYSSKLCGGNVKKVPFEEILKELNSNLIFLCNPNNPTSEIIERDDILEFLKQYKGLLVLDEAYIEYLDKENDLTFAEFVSQHENVMVIRSPSKFYGISGVRLGYCLANNKIIQKLDKYRISWNVNSIAEKVGIISLQDKEFEKESKQFIKTERAFMSKALKEFNGNDSKTTFFLINVDGSKKIVNDLEKEGILLRDCSSFGLENTIRIAFQKREANKTLIDTLHDRVKSG